MALSKVETNDANVERNHEDVFIIGYILSLTLNLSPPCFW